MGRLQVFLVKHIELILFALLSLVVLWWFGGWNYIHQIDSLFFLSPERRLHEVVYFWKAGETLGLSMSEFNLYTFYLSQYALVSAFEPLLGSWNALVASEAVIYYLSVFLAFVFSNLFLRQFFRQVLGYEDITTRDRVIILIVTLFYVINPYTISTVYWRFMTWTLFWAALPLLLYLFLRFLETKRWRYLAFSAVVLITPLGAGFPQIGFINLGIAYLGLFLLWYLRQPQRGWVHVKQFAMFFLVFAALAAWIVIPQFLSLSSTSNYTSAPDLYSDLDYLQFSSQFTTIDNTLRLVGNYLLYNNVNSFPYTWSDGYLSNGVVMASLYVFPILAAVAIWFLGSERERGRRKVVLAIAAAYVLLPLLMKGVSPPISGLGTFLFDLQSTFFRHPYDRFVGLFLLLNALLMLYALRNISLRLPDRRRFIGFSLVMVLLIAGIGYPFFTGQVVGPLDKIDLSTTNYMDLEESLGDQLGQEGRIIVFPFSISGEYSYNISGDVNRPNSKSLAYDFIPQASILQFTLSPYDRFALGYIYEVIKNNDTQAFFSFMYHLNVKALLLQKDYSTEFNRNPYTAIPAEDATIFLQNLVEWESLEQIYDDPNVAIYAMPSVPASNLVGGQPALLLGAYSEVPTISIQKPLVPLTGIWGYDPELFETYSDLLVSDSPDTIDYLVNLMSEKLCISPYELGRLSSDGWEKYPTMDALYSNSTLILEDGTSYTDGEEMANWTFSQPSDLEDWVSPPGSNATVSLSGQLWPWTSGLVMTMANGTSGTSYLDGPEVNVTSNNILWSINWMKTYNARDSNIAVLGHDQATGGWSMLNYSLPGISGSGDWEEYSFTVVVPENVDRVKLRLIASSPEDPDLGDARTWFDNLALYSMANHTTSPFMKVPIDVPETGRYFLLSEVLVSPTGGNIDIEIAGANSTFATLYPQQKWIWVDRELYLNRGTYTALVHSMEGTNSVRTMSLINETNYIEARHQMEAALGGNNIFISSSAASFFRENATLEKDNVGAKRLSFLDNGSAWTTLSIASEGEYRMSLYGSGSFTVSIDGTPIPLATIQGGARAVSAVHLAPGSYNLSVNGTTGSYLDSMWAYNVVDGVTLDQFRRVDTQVTISEERINPAHYRVHASTDGPFMLCLPQSYDPQWTATVSQDGKVVGTVHSVALYGCLNGFWIDATGEDITIEVVHVQQRLFDVGLVITALAMVLVGLLAVVEWRYGDGAAGRKGRELLSRLRRRGP